MNKANGPRSLHSPFSAPELESPPDAPLVGDDAEVIAASAAEWEELEAIYESVGERIKPDISAISAVSDIVAVRRGTSSGDMESGTISSKTRASTG